MDSVVKMAPEERRRFSEDIDRLVDRDTLGFGGDASPERAPSNAQRKKRLEGLTAACRGWGQERLQPAFAERIAERVSGPHSVRPDPDDADGQCLLFEYPGASREAEAGYVRPVVKIELGARSDDWPATSHSFTPYLAEALPDIVPDATVSFRTADAERTSWEKAMLHEETYCFVDCQMFFDFKKAPNIKAALKAEVDPEEFTLKLNSEPFPVRGYKRLAVKVVDGNGNESVVVRGLA